MELIYLLVTLAAGFAIGFFAAGRKTAAAKAQFEAAREREALMERLLNDRMTQMREQ